MDDDGIGSVLTLLQKYLDTESDWQARQQFFAAVEVVCRTFLDADERATAYADRSSDGAAGTANEILLATDRSVAMLHMDPDGSFSFYVSSNLDEMNVGYCGAVAFGGYDFYDPRRARCDIKYRPPVLRIRLPEDLAEVARGSWWEWPVPAKPVHASDAGHLEPYYEWMAALGRRQSVETPVD